MRINKFCILFLAFFLVMVPVGVVAEESEESNDLNSEVSETTNNGDELEGSDSLSNNPEENSDESLDEEEESEVEPGQESLEEEISSDSNQDSRNQSDENKEHLETENAKEEFTYDNPQEKSEEEKEELGSDSELHSNETSSKANNQSVGTVNDKSNGQTEETPKNDPENEETEEDKNKAQMNSLSIQATSTGLPYKVEDSAEEISEIKEKLNAIGFSGILVTDYFGDFTEKRVKEFQDYYGLSATGEINKNTLNQLNEVYDSPHQLGKSDSGNKDIKEKLNAIGYGDILVTDYFGDFTEKRVIEFQKDHNLKAHGIIDSKTIAKLNEIYDSAIRPGQSDPILVGVKEKLNSLGFGGIIVTEYYGDFTVKRVKEFQRFAGLTANGVLDEQTLTVLDNLALNGYGTGDSHSNIATMKKKLNRVGFSGILVTNYYGSFTEKRIREFQGYYGLKVTGRANQETLDQLDSVYNSPLQAGKSHSDLKEIKEQLNAIGYDGILVTSYFGDFTEKRVKEFQSNYSLKSHGIVDGKTLEKLNEVYHSAIWPGQSNPELIEIKEKLNRLGFGGIIVTSYYGDFTEKRVKEFQDYYGLNVNGIIDLLTYNKINEVYSHPFQLGKNSNKIIEIKQKLNSLGFSGILETSYFGDFTEKRVMEFQEYYNLKANGIVDEVTQNKLDEVYNNSYFIGKSDSEIIEVKKLLNNLGYSGILETSYFGDYTEKKVKEFQGDYGLRVTGVVDPITYKELEDQVVSLFIDPGHGGHDSGATGFGLLEKDVVLDISLRLASELSENYYGIMVNLSRTVDKFVELERRAELANKLGSDYFISVHSNAYRGLGRGFETFIHDQDITQEDRKRQNDIHDYLIDRIGVTDRGKKDANFSVLRNSEMPSLLIEYLFIDNRDENALLRQSSYRQKLAKWTAEAIAESFGLRRK